MQHELEWVKVREYFSVVRGNIRYVVAPFMQADPLLRITGEARAPTVILTRWNAGDLLSGASDLEVFPLADDRGWKLYIHPRLHAKVYSWDLRTAITGSANVTRTGLGLHDDSNEEYLTDPMLLPVSRRFQLRRVLAEAQLMSRSTYSEARAWLDEQERVQHVPNEDLLLTGVDQRFLISALPTTPSPKIFLEGLNALTSGHAESLSPELQDCILHDAATLAYVVTGDRDQDKATLRGRFLSAAFVREIDRQLQPSLQFGRLKEWIQSNCEDVPVPTRRELTETVQVLLEWFVSLAPDLYVVDVPGRYSQRLRRRDRM